MIPTAGSIRFQDGFVAEHIAIWKAYSVSITARYLRNRPENSAERQPPGERARLFSKYLLAAELWWKTAQARFNRPDWPRA